MWEQKQHAAQLRERGVEEGDGVSHPACEKAGLCQPSSQFWQIKLDLSELWK